MNGLTTVLMMVGMLMGIAFAGQACGGGVDEGLYREQARAIADIGAGGAGGVGEARRTAVPGLRVGA